VDRIKRISFEVLDEHKSKFGEDFVENKKALNQIAIVRSKGLKNKVAGYITRFIKKQIREEKIKHDRSGMNSSNVEEQESTLEITESDDVSEIVEEITLTNEEVESIESGNVEVKPIVEKIMVSASDIAEKDSILKSNSDNTSEEKTE
jgi:small subunit ribosomal protein S17e